MCLKPESKKMEKRNSSIELIRIFATLFIIVAHVSQHGVLGLWSDKITSKIYDDANMINSIILMFGSFGQIGVSLFFIITGFYSSKRDDVNYSKLLSIVIQVFFYTILTSIIAFLFLVFNQYPEFYGDRKWLFYTFCKVLIVPISSSSYWFVTVYLILVLLTPHINKLIANMETKFFLFITLIYFIEYIFSYVVLRVTFGNIISAIFFHIIGGGYLERKICFKK